MKRPSFIEGAIFALAVSTVGSVLLPVLSWTLPTATVLRLLIAGIGFSYVIYLLSRNDERIGRVTTIVVWSVAAMAVWIFAPSIVLYALLHLALVWLVRSMYFYSSALSALLDLGLSGFSLATTLWVASWTGSFFMTLWSFFLMQALFVAIPSSWKSGSARVNRPDDSNDRFEHAYHAAQSAVRKLSIN
ncbi:MAG: hypothetical protein ACN4GR_13645 [Arenicellales bacterium]